MSTRDREALLDTIRRLLALAGRPNEFEAAAAMAKAHELLVRHHLDMAEIGRESQGAEPYVDEVIWSGGRLAVEMGFVGPIVQRYFFVRLVAHSDWLHGRLARTVTIFGRKADVPFARHVTLFLLASFRRLWADYRKRTGAARGDQRAFYAGLYDGLTSRLERERRGMLRPGDGTALAVIDSDVDEAARRHYGHIRGPRRGTPIDGSLDALVDGTRVGANIRIQRPLPGFGAALLGHAAED